MSVNNVRSNNQRGNNGRTLNLAREEKTFNQKKKLKTLPNLKTKGHPTGGYCRNEEH